MKTVKSKSLMAAIVLGMMTTFGGVSYAAPANANVAVNVTVQQNVKGVVNWEKGSSANVEAVGLGLPPANMLGTRGVMLARRAAVVDAYRQLAEVINGVQVDAETTMRELAIESDIVRTKTQALIKGASIVEEHVNKDGSYTVKMVLPLYGASSVASVAIPEIHINEYPDPQMEGRKGSASVSVIPKVEAQESSTFVPVTPKVGVQVASEAKAVAPKAEVKESNKPALVAPKAEVQESSTSVPVTPKVDIPTSSVNIAAVDLEKPTANSGSIKQGSYTGVIIDASGLGLEGTFSPLIFDETGRIIYGMRNIDKEYAISHGMVEYSKDVRNQTRAGENPLVIKAVGIKGGANSVNRVNVIVSKEDAEKILQVNEQSAILDNKAVVFIK